MRLHNQLSKRDQANHVDLTEGDGDRMDVSSTVMFKNGLLIKTENATQNIQMNIFQSEASARVLWGPHKYKPRT